MWVYSDWSRVYRVLVNIYTYMYIHVQIHVSPMVALPSDRLCFFPKAEELIWGGKGKESCTCIRLTDEYIRVLAHTHSFDKYSCDAQTSEQREPAV